MKENPAPCSLEVREVSCIRGAARLEGASLRTMPGTLNALCGIAESKALLLRILGLLEAPDTGAVLLFGQDTASLEEPERGDLRTRRFGYVFQSPFLLPAFTVVENVAMPLFKTLDVSPKEAGHRTAARLDFVGLAERQQEHASELSAAEQHAVALARALVIEPDVLIVEDLDGQLAGLELKSFTSLLRRAAATWGITVIATVSGDWQGEIGDYLYEVSEQGVQATVPALPATS